MILPGSALLCCLAFLCISYGRAAEPKERTYAEVETRLRPLAIPLAKPEPGDWLAEHQEDGQTFAAYLRAKPVRKSAQQGTIYICLLGDFTPEQRKVLETTQKYLEIFYQVPVKVHKKMTVADVPARARRIHPTWGRRANPEHLCFRRSAEAGSPRGCVGLSRVHVQRFISRSDLEFRLWPGQPPRADRRLVHPPQRGSRPGREGVSALPAEDAAYRQPRDRAHPDDSALHGLGLQHEWYQQPGQIGRAHV